jgi:hypothetical protein
LLVSTTGITVKRHYCLGQFQFASLNIWSLPCCADDAKNIPPCCSDDFEHIEVEDDFQLFAGVDLIIPDVLTALPPAFLQRIKIEPEELSKVYYQNYKPPLISIDRQVELQSFLI